MKNKSTLLQISQLGHKILRQKARPVNKKSIKSGRIQELIGSLVFTLKDANGVGIAAPQVYQSLRIFIVASAPNARYPKAPEMKPTPVINPKIIFKSKEIIKDWEGCLSIPGIRGLVPRHKLIETEYFNEKGGLVKKTFKDFVARIFQHEYDHLDGIVYLDRLESSKDIIAEKEYMKRIAKKK